MQLEIVEHVSEMLSVPFNKVLHDSLEATSIFVRVSLIVLFNCKTNILKLLKSGDAFNDQVHLGDAFD